MPTHSLDDNVSLYYDILGDSGLPGEPVLLVTGTSTSIGHWTPAILEGLAADRRVIVYDHRGMGGSSAYTEPVSMASLAADAIALLDELGVGPVHVVGWSLGSAVAQELALARPDLVASLVLYGTWARGNEFQRSLTAGLRSPWAHGDLEGGIAALGVAFSPEFLDSPEFGQVITAVLPLFPQTEEQIQAVVRQWDADLAHDILDRLPAIDRPTTVLVGEQDILTPPRQSRTVADAIPDAEFVLVEGPGASHSLHVERPDEWLEHVRAHLERCE
ncbi:alpha/beta fold hydrolase [Amycolatopsis jejuensis]|uniref:alpha/beta fold hydrolase n=1 Tax=Amycolatopsis jejuensis TaxID=330084 RepID=UPI00052691E9|nr:alpha/beta hydrolase [Amycolatopsis jejuensis]